jgi:class 3 adenylate cyclase/tetratricopeptide (TPR) repeat protein
VRDGDVMQTSYRAVEDTLRAYLPATLVQHWERRPEQPPLWGTWLTGSLMFCDISGFTAMSEDLARVGKEGAELMASVLNRFFERMLAIADEWGGAQMKFGGDAMLLYFSGPLHAKQAAAAGLDMQSAMAEFRRLSVAGNEYRLRMRIAIHSGRFYGASVGQPKGLLHYLLVGPDVNRTAAIEGAGEPGQVVVSAETAAEIGDGCRLDPVNGVWRVRELEPPPRPASREDPAAFSSVLKQYVLPPISAPVVQGHAAGVSGEHRRVTAVFINVAGISTLLQDAGEAQALAQADAYVKMVIGAVERHGGFLAASDLAPEGDKLICLFGVPVSVEGAEKAALRAMLELDQELKASDLDLTHRIGVNSGHVFAGEIGSSKRREYTVIGDTVNLAARLMAAARPGEILASKLTADRAGAGFDLQRLRALRVKGKAAAVPVCRLRGFDRERLVDAPAAESSPLIGREAEMSALLGLSQRVTSRGEGGWAYLWGDPGIGKSRLTKELASQLVERGWHQVFASCQLHTRQTSFAPWREPLRKLLGVALGEAPEETWRRLHAALESADPELAPLAPLLAELLSLPVPDSKAIPTLDPKERRRHLISMVVALVGVAAVQRPLIILFEDVHWADALSLELLAAVLAERPRILAVVTSREPSQPAELAAAGAPVSMRISDLSPEAARRLVMSTSGFGEKVVDRVISRAQGNPLFLHEISRIGIGAGEPIPETVNDVILARLDRLRPQERTVLRLASVIGPTFNLEELRAVAGPLMDAGGLDEALAELRAQGFARHQGEDVESHAFEHALTRDVAYETLPYAERRRLHRRAAYHIEERDASRLEAVSELLLNHYEVVADKTKVVRYAAMSGGRAAAIFAVEEAKGFYRRALSALGDEKRLAADRSVVYERLGDCLETAAQHKEAQDSFALALEEWRLPPRRPRLVSSENKLRTREGDLCRKLAVSLERRSAYDEALDWLDQALRALPPGSARATAKIYTARSLTLFRKGLYEEALHWGREGLSLSRRGSPHQLAYAHTIVANTYSELGRLKQALRHDRMAVRFYHEVGDLPGQALANGNVAVSYQMMGVLDGALYHYELGLNADQRIGNTSHAAIMHNNIAEVLMMMGRLDEATAHLEKALDAYRSEPGLAGLAGLSEVNISRCLLLRNFVDDAMTHLRRGMRLLRSVGVEGVMSEALLQKAELHLASGDPLRARRECRRAMIDIRAREARVLEARAERLLGRTEASMGRASRARAHFRTSIAIARGIGAGYEEALSLRELGSLLRGVAGASGQAQATLGRAVKILSRMGAALDLAEAQYLLEREKAASQVAGPLHLPSIAQPAKSSAAVLAG